MKKIGYLTDVDFWLKRQGQKINNLPIGGVKPSWLKLVRRYLPKNMNASCIEIGVVPGITLLYLATHYKYKPVGLDFSPRVQELGSIFSDQGVEAEFIEADFFAWTTDKKFDLVYSNGFIEHFEDDMFVVQKHWNLVKPGGILLLTIPFLTPFQYFVRWLFYKPEKWEEIKISHNPKVTPERVKEMAEALPDGTILLAKYTSEMRIWFGIHEWGVKKNLALLFILLKGLDRIFHLIGISSRWYSPEFLVLIRKE